MTTYTKHLLSGSVNGKNILVSATSSPGTLIHTGVEGSLSLDEVWIYATNSIYSPVTLTVQWGALSGSSIELSIPGESGYTLVVPGILIQNSLEIRAFASTSSLLINGYVNRITQ